MKTKTCCITGHRKIELLKIADVKKVIREHILQAIDDGYTYFISGFAEGVDLYFTEIVAELKNEYNITLEVTIPYRGRMKTKDTEFKQLIKHCDEVEILVDKFITPFPKENRKYMHARYKQVCWAVEQSDFLIYYVYDKIDKN